MLSIKWLTLSDMGLKYVPQTVNVNDVVMWANRRCGQRGDMVKLVEKVVLVMWATSDVVKLVIWTKAVGDAVSIMDRTARGGK